MDEFDITEGFPHLSNVGEVLEKPKYIISLSTNPERQYGTNDLGDDSTNELIHWVMMRTENITMAEAIAECCAKQPVLFVTDVEYSTDYQAEYITIH